MAGNERRIGRSDRKEMPFLDHLEELRGVFLQSAFAVLLAAIGGWFLSTRAIDLLVEPVGSLVFLGPSEAFTLRMKVALLLGLLIALPFVLFKIWGFVAPGLFAREKKAVGLVVGGSTILFLGGAAFAFLVFVPIAVHFLLGFSTDTLRPMITAGNYFSFVAKLILAFGVVFQLPLVVAILAYFGLLQPEWLLRQWRYAIVLIACVATVLTPTTDIASLVLMGLPLVVLYFLSALLAFAVRGVRRREKAREAAEKAEGSENAEGAGGAEGAEDAAVAGDPEEVEPAGDEGSPR